MFATHYNTEMQYFHFLIETLQTELECKSTTSAESLSQVIVGNTSLMKVTTWFNSVTVVFCTLSPRREAPPPSVVYYLVVPSFLTHTFL